MKEYESEIQRQEVSTNGNLLLNWTKYFVVEVLQKDSFFAEMLQILNGCRKKNFVQLGGD